MNAADADHQRAGLPPTISSNLTLEAMFDITRTEGLTRHRFFLSERDRQPIRIKQLGRVSLLGSATSCLIETAWSI